MCPQNKFIVCDRRWHKSNIIMLELCRAAVLNVCAKLESMENTLHYIIVKMFHQQNENNVRQRQRVYAGGKILLFLLCFCPASFIFNFSRKILP